MLEELQQEVNQENDDFEMKLQPASVILNDDQ